MKPRKPKLKGWRIFTDTIWKSGAGVMHDKSGRFWLGSKQIRDMGKFMIKAADWIEGQQK